MAPSLKIVAFVEGGEGMAPSRVEPHLKQIWCDQLPRHLSLLAVSRVVPISKKNIIAMDPSVPAMSGAGEGLDALLMREQQRAPFDVALVAWDLAPPWDPTVTACRWTETVSLYAHLSKSELLVEPWKTYSTRRFQEMSKRKKPSARKAPPALEKGAILPLCMSPEFERFLVQKEKAIKSALGVEGKRMRDWPPWDIDEVGRGNTTLLQSAIRAARNVKDPSPIVRQIRGDMITAKDEWGSYFIRELCATREGKERLRGDPLGDRLVDLLAAARRNE